MKLIPYDKAKIDYIGYKKTKNQKVIGEFIESGYECVKIQEHDCMNASVCAFGLNRAIKRMKIGNMIAISRKGEVYLIKV